MLCGKLSKKDKKDINRGKEIEGTVVLMKKNVLDTSDFYASFLDKIYEIAGKHVSLQLISAVHLDPETGRGKLGKPAYLEKWVSSATPITAGDITLKVAFDWDESIGPIGAFLIKNFHYSEFYLKTLTLEDVPEHGRIHFICNSWVYPVKRYKYDRIFFTNKTYLPHDTPEPLRKYREDELVILRGDGKGKLKEWDRVYDYAYYNDLGNPDKGPEYARPVLGGSKEFPYPRRGRTGRKPTKTDPNTESSLPLLDLNVYVPRDEKFKPLKLSDFLAYAIKSIVQVVPPEVETIAENPPNEFQTLEDVMKIYEGGIKLPKSLIKELEQVVSWEFIKGLIPTDGEGLLKFPLPEVIKEDKTAWRTDQEFAREMLAGTNPLVISRLQVFPPTSKLNPQEYGNQNSTITKDQVEKNMDGYTVHQAIEKHRLFILDHHDTLMPYLPTVNSTTTKTYATRTVLFLKDDGTLKPVAIELSLPHPEGKQHGAISEVYTPAETGIEGSVWQLAKAYVVVNDSGYHELISHWLHTHAVIEPFVIATNRQLSVLHPIYKLLHPHYRYTMNINAMARHILINAGGLLELTVYPKKYALELSSFIYKDWNFTEQALPADLLRRGMAVKDSKSPHGLKLLLEDYPYAVDGLDVWSAIEKWVDEYCTYYYPADELIQRDTELQSWWTELRNKGHGDLKDEPWWPDIRTRNDLIKTCTTIIWIASALHAAVNFGQYPYGGYMPNRPTISRHFMPQPGTPEYVELESDPDRVFLRTIPGQLQTLLGIAVIELLSRHSTDELYLGQRETDEWTTDKEPLAAFESFTERLIKTEDNVIKKNNDKRLKNRVGPVKLPYTLLFPSTSDFSKAGGLTGRGIPNSASI